MNNDTIINQKTVLSELFQVGLTKVNGQRAVERQLDITPINGSVAIIAIGKAASSMMLGAQNRLKEQIKSALIITKTGHTDKTLNWPCIEAGHPIPNTNSLEAGAQLIDFLSNIPEQTTLLALISGGASALVDVLPDDMGLAELQKMNQWLLASGLGIHEMNRVRQSVSLVKGGKALNYLLHDSMKQFVISDVENDELEIIGSGLFVTATNKSEKPDMPDWLKKYSQKALAVTKLKAATHGTAKVDVESHIIANNEIACRAIISHAQNLGLEVTYHGETLYDDVFDCAEKIASELIKAKSGVHIWGGETTLTLPQNPGRGGRNQSLALALAILLENSKSITVLVGATDGSDGPTEDAGAIIDGQTVTTGDQRSAQAKESLLAADAGSFLAEAGALISTGPTGTNVMDIVLAIKA